MKPTPAELVVEMEEEASIMEMDVDDAEGLDIFTENLLDTTDQRRLSDSDFFNSFEDDFNDADIN